MNNSYIRILTILAVFGLVLSSSTLAFADGYTGVLDSQMNESACGVASFLKGSGGWLIIGFGMILAVWDYFVQKQGQLLIAAVIGILAVVVLGRAIWAGADCDQIINSSLSPSQTISETANV